MYNPRGPRKLVVSLSMDEMLILGRSLLPKVRFDTILLVGF